MKSEKSFYIGTCQILPFEFAIKVGSSEKVSIQPKIIEVLCYLAKEYPRIIPREELIEHVWSGNSYVGPKALTNAIWHLRKNLADANIDSEVIETLRNVGYRLLIEPKWVENTNDSEALSSTNDKQAQPVKDGDNRLAELWQHNYFRLASLVVVLVLLSVYFIFPSPTQQVIVTQITKDPGSEFFPSPSPDGRYLVYKSLHANTPSQLYLKDISQPQLPAKQLTFGTDNVSLSVWSNSGEYLFYNKINLRKKNCQVMQLTIATNQSKQLANCSLASSHAYIDISFDDSLLAFHSDASPPNTDGIYFLSLDNENSKPARFSCLDNCIDKDWDMAFSPNGNSIAVTRRVSRFEEHIFLIDLTTKDEQQLTFTEEDIVGLSWHPGGEYLVYGSQLADERHAYSVNINTKQIDKLNFDSFSFPAFAKQSGELFFEQRTEQYHLSSLQLNDTVTQSPFPLLQSKFNHHYPDYSAQAKLMVYVSNESGFYELWSIDSQGNNRKQLTNLKRSILYPKFSHDGSQIAFLAKAQDKAGDNIYLLDIESQKLSVLPSPFSRHNRPTWSFDDSKIISAIYDHGYNDLFQISIADGSSEQLTVDGGQYGIMVSAETLLFTNAKKGLWQKDISREEPAKIVIQRKHFNSSYTWNVQQNGIFYRHNTGNYHQLRFYDFNTLQRKLLVNLPLRTFENLGALTYIEDSDKLIFASSQFPQTDIKRLSHLPLQ